MEDFSTPRRPLVPVVANLATAAVLLTATWMSAVQRPRADGLPMASREAKSVPAANRNGTDRAAADGNHAKWMRWSSDQAPVPALQPVGYVPNTTTASR